MKQQHTRQLHTARIRVYVSIHAQTCVPDMPMVCSCVHSCVGKPHSCVSKPICLKALNKTWLCTNSRCMPAALS